MRKMAVVYDRKDHGYAWVILAASVLLQALYSSSIGTFGFYLVEYLEVFRQNKATTTGVGSMMFATGSFTAVFIGPLVKVFGAKRMTQLGTLLLFVGTIMSAFAPNVYTLYITQGLIMGVGYSCWTICAVIVQFYFSKRRGLATALTATGISLGVMFWSRVIPYLIQEYTFRGALLIQAAINANGFVVGALYRSPVFPRVDEEMTVIKTGHKEDKLNGDLKTDETSKSGDDSSKYDLCEHLDRSSYKSVNSEEEIDTETSKDSQKYSLTDNHAMYPSEDCNGNENDESDNHHDNEIIALKEDDVEIKSSKCLKVVHAVRNAFILTGRNLTDTALLRNRRLVLFYLAVFLCNCGNFVPPMFLPVRIYLSGGEKKDAALLLTSLAITSIFFRSLCGWIADRKWSDRIFMYSITATLGGLLSVGSHFIHTIPGLIVYVVAYGINSSCYVGVQSTILGDLIGMKELPKALGHVVFLAGAALLISSAAAGAMIERTGSGTLHFLVMGGIQCVGGLVAGGVYFLQRSARHKKPPPDMNL